ncbi:MAG: PilC/PilY family type IV pilus protein, partial [Sulfuricaulis sp.]|nr:PilC/PilY family type IV pilus protein [Sulfuricaulis sp.]
PDNYFLVTDPAGLETAMTTAFTNILKETGTASAVAVNTATLNTESAIYQAKFTSGTWSGKLEAKTIDPFTGVVSPTATWDAAVKLRGQNWNSERAILTTNLNIAATKKGAKFRYGTPDASSANIGTTNAAFLNADGNGSARVNFLRGDTSNEGGIFRDRDDDGLDFKLGDIVNSAPIFVGPPPFLYPDNMEAVPYSTFRNDNSSRMPIVYVGGNDGMLHGFNACTSTTYPGCGDATQHGLEKIAYVPSNVYPNLSGLSNPSYLHQYFVDLSPTTGDVFGNFSTTVTTCTTNCWRTIVVGGLRGGGAGYFALDVTDPSDFSEANASTLVLWEFKHPDMGYSYSEPTIARMKNGKWAVIFGSGYTDGATGTNKAALFILDAITGQIMSGMSGPIVLDSTSNGLSSPLAVDVDGDSIADYVYAGDLKGNMWKIDVKDTDPGQWKSFYKVGTTPKPLFTAVDGAGNVQPITSRPEVGKHPSGQAGFMVYFGTGKYIEVNDNTPSATPVHTFY